MQVALSRNGVIYNIIEAQSVAAAQALFPDANAFEAVGVGIGWREIDGEWVSPEPPVIDPPSPIETPPKLLACALRIPIVDGEVQAIGGAYRIPALMLMDTGTFLAVFSENLGEAEPFLIPNNGIHVSISEWGGDYAMIEVRDHAGGSLLTPASFGFSLYSF